MSGIIGDNNPLSSGTPVEHSVDSRRGDENINSKTRSEQKPKKSPGRPRKGDDNDDTSATFIISSELLKKIKYICLMEDAMQKDVVGEALSLYVSKWEEDNGKIRIPKK